MIRIPTALLGLASTSLLACSEPNDDTGNNLGGQGGQDSYGCEILSSTELGMDELTELGFSGQGVLDNLAGEHSEDLEWANGNAASTLTVHISGNGGARWVDLEPPANGNEGGAALYCEDYLELDLAITVVSADGAFDESWTGTASAQYADALAANIELDTDNLGGSYTVTELDPSEWDTVDLNLWLAVDLGGPRGELSLISTYADKGGGDDAVAMAQNTPVAQFPPGMFW